MKGPDLFRRAAQALLWPCRAAVEHRKRRACTAGDGTRLLPGSTLGLCGTPDKVRIGRHCRIHGALLTFTPDALLTIGDHVYLGTDSRIFVHRHVQIGDRVQIGHRVDILDSNTHALSAAQRHREYLATLAGDPFADAGDVKAAATRIEDDAWVGLSACILKGVRIGRGAVVAAHSVVTADVPDFTVVAGNPARAVGRSLP